MEVLELTNNPQVDTRALKQCIETDPALTVKVLRVVNSSLYGLSREVSDLNQALALLGTKPLKLLVLGFSLPPGLFTGVAGNVLARYWQHTLVKAVAARELAETLWRLPGDEAFIAGLLQDIGSLLLIQELGQPYVLFLDKVLAGGGNLIALETKSLGFDHTMLTSGLMVHWKLPEALVQAVSAKTTDLASDASPEKLPKVLHLAELIARFLAEGRPGVLQELLAAGKRHGNLSADRLEETIGGLKEKVQQLADVLSLDVSGQTDYQELLIRAHRQLSDVAAEVAEEIVRDGLSVSIESDTESLLAEIEMLSKVILGAPNDLDDVSASPPAGLSIPDPAPSRPPREPVWQLPPTKPSSTADRAIATAERLKADPGLLGRLAAAVATCRQNRCALSLMLVELDRAADLALLHGVQGFENLCRRLGAACHGLDHPGTLCLSHNESGFAVILPDCERPRAVQLGQQLLDRVRQLPTSGPAADSAISVSVGVATLSLPPKNFPPDELLERAARCLYGSRASGGGVVKSIEIY
jgi:HD-like signal output (HDOD) protein/GGDEF domain-containing protein